MPLDNGGVLVISRSIPQISRDGWLVITGFPLGPVIVGSALGVTHYRDLPERDPVVQCIHVCQSVSHEGTDKGLCWHSTHVGFLRGRSRRLSLH